MKTHNDCIPCFISQSLEAARMATSNEGVHTSVLKKVMQQLQNIDFTKSPPELSRVVHKIIQKETKTRDPYKQAKKQSNNMGKKLYPQLQKRVGDADDPLLTAIKLAIVGNVIDFGTMNRFNVDDMINRALNREFDDTSYPQFKKKLRNANNILYLADNAGEVFFDKLLLKQIDKEKNNITYVVKANPIINDATVADARFAGIDKIASVVESDKGQKWSAPGMVSSLVSEEILDMMDKADMIISKGQGNYEGLSSSKREIFFLLVVKCHLVAEDIKSEVGKLILKEK